MRNNIKISVLLPVYNAQKYLDRCILSILNQTFKDFELIIINDGSTDNSIDIIEHYKNIDSRIVLIDKINSGYGHSLNIGIGTASGEYISIIESDDFFEANAFEKLYYEIISGDYDIVKSNFYKYFNLKTNRKPFREIKDEKTLNIISNPELLLLKPSVWSMLIKKNFLLANNISFLETKGASFQDTSFFYKILISASKIRLIPDYLINYSIDNVYSSVNSKDKVFSVVRELDEIERFLKQKNIKQNNIWQIFYVVLFKTYKWNLKRISRKNKLKFLIYFAFVFDEIVKENKINKLFYKFVSKIKFDLLLKNKKMFYFIVQLEDIKDKCNIF